MPDELPDDTYYYPRTVYPVLWRHPRTGEELIFANEHMSLQLEGIDKEQGEAIFGALFEILYDPQYVYEHCWKQGDLVIWDNLALQHGRRAFYGNPGVRTLIRTTINPAQDAYLEHGKRVLDYAKLKPEGAERQANV